jgi:hypothetical protein
MISLLLAWVVFPVVLGAVGAGWGLLVERASGRSLGGALLIPTGLAAALVVAGTLTAFAGSAPAAVPVIGVGAVAGLLVAAFGARVGGAESKPRWALIGRWPLLAAAAALVVYGAPVLLTGQATFTGFVKLDDTATWLNIADIVMHHGRSVTSLPQSTFRLLYEGDVGPTYPLGAFMLLGIGHGLTGINSAWIFQPYEACCGAAIALSVYALVRPVIGSRRICALIAFLAAQPALLYGYSLWGGIKEMTAAFLLATGVALAARHLRNTPERVRDARALLPLAVAAGALIQTFTIGAAGWIAPAVLLLAAAWFVPWLAHDRGDKAKPVSTPWPRLAALGGLAAMTAAFMIPVWTVLAKFLGHDAGLFTEGQSQAEKLGNLIQPLSGWQLAGIWPVGDFRFTAPTLPSVLLIGLVLLAAVVGIVWAGRRRELGIALYVVVVVASCLIYYLTGASPWVLGKALSSSSPALLTAALTGAALLAGYGRGSQGAQEAQGKSMRRLPAIAGGTAALVALAFGVLWSNALAYNSVTIAPRDRLAEMQHIGELVNGKGPTFVNLYEVYADRHFLGAGAPVEPAEYRPATLPLREGVELTKGASADLDSFPIETLLPYRSIVTQRAPVESRPPSLYQLVWQGRYYQLWQRSEDPTTQILEHIPYGESTTKPYCGEAENGSTKPLCSINAVAIPDCPQLLGFARKAAFEHAHLVAYERPDPVTVLGDEVRWPGAWEHSAAERSLSPTTPGAATGEIVVPTSQRYELFLGGSFARGFEVRIDGHRVGSVENELALSRLYAPVAQVYLKAGVHRFEYIYPESSLAPGSGWNFYTSLSAIVLEPLQFPRTEMVSVQPSEASRLCGHPLDWLELVANS